MRATMTKKGQVLIPKAVRDTIGLVPGEVDVSLDPSGAAIVRPVPLISIDKQIDAAVAKWAGKGLDLRPTDVIMRELRGEDLP